MSQEKVAYEIHIMHSIGKPFNNTVGWIEGMMSDNGSSDYDLSLIILLVGFSSSHNIIFSTFYLLHFCVLILIYISSYS